MTVHKTQHANANAADGVLLVLYTDHLRVFAIDRVLISEPHLELRQEACTVLTIGEQKRFLNITHRNRWTISVWKQEGDCELEKNDNV